MDEFKNLTLIRAAIAKEYGSELQSMAKDWVIRCLVDGKQIPFSLSELFEAYHDFDEVFVREFLKKQNWYVIWQMANAYCEYKDKYFVFPRILLELLGSSVSPLVKEQVQSWLMVQTKNPKIGFILLEKVQKFPELMEWSLNYLAKFKEFSDATKMIGQIKRVACSYPQYNQEAVRLIACVASSGRGYHYPAVKALAELSLMKELSDKQRNDLNQEIARQLDAMDIVDLCRIVNESILSPAHRIAVGSRLVCRGYWSKQIVQDVSTIYRLAFDNNHQAENLMDNWNAFVQNVFKYHPEVVSELFLVLSGTIADYVKKMQWEVPLMEWNSGMNFHLYAPEFKRMTIKSMDLATECKQFRPRAFLTALNVWLFDTSNVFNDEWFERFVSRLPQNHDKSMTWDDDLQKLFEHLARVYRYRTEFQHTDGRFVIKQAKLFVQMLVGNYALNPTQIAQMRSLCARLQLDVNVTWEVQIMEKRLQQIAQGKEQEKQYLMQLFS